MAPLARSRSGAAVGVLLLLASWTAAQTPGDPVWPPPAPPTEPAEEDRQGEGAEGEEEKEPPSIEDFIPDSDAPWGLPQELRERLAERAEVYRSYALRFFCIETVRTASYDRGEATKETRARYEYILDREPEGYLVRESRQKIKASGKIVAAESGDDEVAFPPAYGWTLLFSSFNQPYFEYREMGDAFAGFDWVRAIGFKGSLPWTDGRDIRQWEGIAIVNAGDLTLLEIRARPTGQKERVLALYKQWVQAFNLIGIRLAEPPRGYHCRVRLGMRRDGLTFPSDLRYDTFRAVAPDRVLPERASIREYDSYRFFVTETQEKVEGTR